MRHVLVSSVSDALVERVRETAPPAEEVLAARGVEETIERIARAARVDVVVTDRQEVLDAVLSEIPGSFPVLLVEPDTTGAAVWALLGELG